MALTIETRKFASQNATRLLGRLAFQMNSTRKAPDAAAVHDLRVSIRRFHQVLSVFKSSFPGKEARKIRRRMKKLMLVAGEVRNLDIALKLLAKSRTPEAAGLKPKLESQRKDCERMLIGALKRRMERANRAGARAAVILGDDDIANGVAQVKDLATGTQEAIPFSQIASRLR